MFPSFEEDFVDIHQQEAQQLGLGDKQKGTKECILTFSYQRDQERAGGEKMKIREQQVSQLITCPPGEQVIE